MTKINLIGQKFNSLTVIGQEGSKNYRSVWMCQCECGTYKKATTDHLKYGYIKSCGCLNRLNLVGKRSGRLVAIKIVGKKNRSYIWECLCDCGNTTQVDAESINHNRIISCGCSRRKSTCKYGHKEGRNKSGSCLTCQRDRHYKSYLNKAISRDELLIKQLEKKLLILDEVIFNAEEVRN